MQMLDSHCVPSVRTRSSGGSLSFSRTRRQTCAGNDLCHRVIPDFRSGSGIRGQCVTVDRKSNVLVGVT